MNNGPSPVQDTERIVAPFEQKTGIDVKVELVGWDIQFDRIRNAAVSGEGPDVTQAGTTQVPFFAALGGFEDLSERASQIGGKSAYAPGIWETTQVVGRDGTWAVPWFTEARTILYRKDALKEAGVDPSNGVHRHERVQEHAAEAGVGRGARRQAHRAVRRSGQEGVRPRPQPDAVGVGPRRLGAERRQQDVDDQQPRGRAGREVRGGPRVRRALGPQPARARRHAGGEPVQGRAPGGVHRRPVGAPGVQALRRRRMDVGGPQEPRPSLPCRTAPQARATRSSAARTS